MKCKIGDKILEFDKTLPENMFKNENCLQLRTHLEKAAEMYKLNHDPNLIYEIKIDDDVYVYFEKDVLISVVLDLIDCLVVSAQVPTDAIFITSSFKDVAGHKVVKLSIQNYPGRDSFGNLDNDLPSTFIHIEDDKESPGGFNHTNQGYLRIFKNEKATRAKKALQQQGEALWLKNNFLLGKGGGLSFEFTMPLGCILN